MYKRDDFSCIIPCKDIKGDLLGSIDHRIFFRTREPIDGVTDFEYRTCDLAVTLHDNALFIPKDGSEPFLDIEMYDDDEVTTSTVQLPAGTMENLLARAKVRAHVVLERSVFDAFKAKAAEAGMNVEKYMAKLLTDSTT